MKKQLMSFVHTSMSSKFFKATALVLVLSGAQYVNAQALSVSTPIERPYAETPKAEISHLDSDNENSFFVIKVNNNEGERFKVIIKQADGTVLFENAYTEKKFSKTYSIPKTESDNLVFVIKGLSGNSTETFEVNSRAHYVEDVVIKKVI